MEHKIPEYKKKMVDELAKLASDKKTILVASIKGIPASQYQEIVKSLRGKADVKVPKKNLIARALDSLKKDKTSELKDKIEESADFALLFSDLDAYELAGELLKSKSPAKAKAGQEAPEDIEIPAGPTDLVPGPAISELGALGIQIQIDKGKIHIKEPKVIAKKGEAIKANAADLMSKLDIKPFSVGFTPLVALDNEGDKIYVDIVIDTEKTVADLKYAYGRALPFAVAIGYANDESIKFLLAKAEAGAKKINRIFTGEPEPEVVAAPAEVQEEKVEEKPKEEEKAPAAEGLGALFG